MNPEQTQPEIQTPPKKSPVEMLRMGLGELVGKFKPKKSTSPNPGQDFAPQEAAPAPEVQVTKSGLPKIPKKIFVIFVAVAVLFVALFLLIRILGSSGRNPLPTSSPSPTPSETPIVEIPSQYADDEDVLRIKSALQELDKNLNEAVFRDDRLRVPSLDWEVEFD